MPAKRKTQRKTNRKTTPKRKQTLNHPMPGWVRFSGILMLILAVAGLAYIHYHKQSLKHTVETKKQAKNKLNPSFDFYELLPNIEVPVANSAPNNSNHAVSPKHRSTKTEHMIYVLQVAAFQRFKDADELKARLSLSGFDVNVHHYQDQKKQDWYRVWIGPYSKKQLALSDQTKLKRQSIASLLLSRKV